MFGTREREKTGSQFTELGKMVEAGLGDFSCGQAEMTSQWCHSAAGHADVKVCARDTGVRAGGPGGEGTGLQQNILLISESASHSL